MSMPSQDNDPIARLMDGPLISNRARKRELVERMAKDLRTYDAVADERDSIRSLFGRGYAMSDIIMLIDDARQVAMQEIVAAEMGKS